MPAVISTPAEQWIEEQTRDLAVCPQCGARRGRACYPLGHEENSNNRNHFVPVAHTGRLRLAMQHPQWDGPKPVLDIQPDCPICTTDPAGHIRARANQLIEENSGNADLG